MWGNQHTVNKKQRTSAWGRSPPDNFPTVKLEEEADDYHYSRATTDPIGVKSEGRAFSFGPKILKWNHDYKNWENLSHSQRLQFLTPRFGTAKDASVDTSFFYRLPKACKSDLSEEKKLKMKEAVEVAKRTVNNFYQRLRREQQAAYCDDEEESDDYDDDPMYCRNSNNADWNGIPEGHAIEFMSALPKNLIFTASFHATGSVQEELELCHCPCSTRYSSQWLKTTGRCGDSIMNLKDTVFSACCTQKYCQDFSLMAHLRQFENDPFHLGILAYINALYSKHYNGLFDHEALWRNVPKEHKKYKRILSYKQSNVESQIKSLKETVRKWRARHDEAKDKTQRQQEIIEHNRAIFDNLGLKEGDEIRAITEEELQKYRENFSKFKIIIRRANGVEGRPDGKATYNHEFEEDIDQKFNISELFQKWYNDNCIFFRELSDKNNKHTNKIVKKLLLPTKWNFRTHYEGCGEDNKGEDEGGLFRIFFSRIWEMIKSLSITTSTGKHINLFYPSGQSIMPQQHETLVYEIARAFEITPEEIQGHDGAQKMLTQSQCYYRAFGRIMIHSLINDYPLPYFLMHNLSKVYLFTGKTPKDTNYLAAELYQHAMQYDINVFRKRNNTLDRDTIHCNLIEPYVIPMKHIKDGLTLDGRIELDVHLYSGSTQILEKLLFSTPEVNIEDVLGTFKFLVRRQGESDEIDTCFTAEQETFKSHVLPAVLKKLASKDPTFLNQFMGFVTGLPYINQGNPTICISFEEEKGGEWALPIAHTCEQELVFPPQVYGCNEWVLEEKLEVAVKNNLITRQ